MDRVQSHLTEISQAETPETLREAVMAIGFDGFLFQRWYSDVMDNWDTAFPVGFLEYYYASRIYKSCPVAIAIHAWNRNFTFKQCRAKIQVGTEEAAKTDRLYREFGMEDGIIVFSGSNDLKSMILVTAPHDVTEMFEAYNGVLSFAAHKLDHLLPSGHSLLTKIDRDDPVLSEMQNKIIRYHIDHPDMSYTKVAEHFGISPKTLLAHHKKIAKKTEVASFTGAIVKRLRGHETI